MLGKKKATRNGTRKAGRQLDVALCVPARLGDIVCYPKPWNETYHIVLVLKQLTDNLPNKAANFYTVMSLGEDPSTIEECSKFKDLIVLDSF